MDVIILQVLSPYKFGQKRFLHSLRQAIGAGFINHLIWVAIWVYLDMSLLVFVNIVGLVVHIGLHYMIKAGHTKPYFAIMTINMMVSVGIATWYVGWASGIAFYLFIPIFGIYSHPNVTIWKKIVFTLVYLSVYLLYYFIFQNPVYLLDSYVVHTLYVYCIINVFAVIALYSHGFWNNAYDYIRYLDQCASTDVLTGLYNRRTMYSRLEEADQQSKSTGTSFSIIAIDIDNFKRFNDTYGHECGDFVLKLCAQQIMSCLRPMDVAARWGGEEFIVLLPGTDLEQAFELAEGIRETIAGQPYSYKEVEHRITITLGVASNKGRKETLTCIQNADSALLEGKARGRNCSVKYAP